MESTDQYKLPTTSAQFKFIIQSNLHISMKLDQKDVYFFLALPPPSFSTKVAKQIYKNKENDSHTFWMRYETPTSVINNTRSGRAPLLCDQYVVTDDVSSLATQKKKKNTTYKAGHASPDPPPPSLTTSVTQRLVFIHHTWRSQRRTKAILQDVVKSAVLSAHCSFYVVPYVPSLPHARVFPSNCDRKWSLQITPGQLACFHM